MEKININKKNIFHSKPSLGEKEANLVAKVVNSGNIACGPITEKFEKEFAKKMGFKYTACVNSGTSALHLVLLAMDIGKNDEVIIPSYVCTALLNAINYVGATPVFAEIDTNSFNICPNDAKKRITKKTKALIVPHMFGMPANICDLQKLNIPIIEDCAQTVLTKVNNKMIGSLGKASIFSFYATKVFAAGEGGMVASSSKALINRIKDLRQYDNMAKYEVRYNYKMTDISAAIGRVQLAKLDDFILRRKEIAKKYFVGFKDLEVKLPIESKQHIYYRYVIRVKENIDLLIKQLKKEHIACAKPVFLPLHQYFGLKNYKKTDKVWNESLSIPIYPCLKDEDINIIIGAIKNYL